MKRIFSLLALSLSCAVACARPTSIAAGPGPVQATRPLPAPVQARTVAPGTPASTASLYDLPVRVTDENGVVKSLDAFRGHPVLITMFYAGCANACPLLTTDLKRLDARIPEPARSDVRILMVSFDAARDTPDVLTRVMKDRDMDATRWTLANATEDDARELGGALGIRYRKLDGGEFFHTSAIVLVDPEGHLSARVDGLGKDPAPILSALGGAS